MGGHSGFRVVKRAALAAAFVILLFALASLYVGGVASLTDRVVHLLRPGPRWASSDTAATDDWALFAETEHFRYFVRPGDQIPRWSMELAEDHLEAACAALDLEFSGVIPFYKHASQSDLDHSTGSRSTGVVLPMADGQGYELHSVHRYDAHEVMHVVAHTALGEPPAFFDEGLATAFGWDWTPEEQDVHLRANRLLQEGRLVPVQRLLANWDFRSYKTYPAYTVAGSLIKYLLTTRGPDKLTGLFALDKFTPTEEIEASFAAAYGEQIYEVEQDWRTALRAGELAPSAAPSSAEGADRELVVTGVVFFAATFLCAAILIVAGERAATQATRHLRTLACHLRRLTGTGAAR